MNKTNLMIMSSALFVIGIGLIVYLVFVPKQTLAENEIQVLLEERYTGEVKAIQREGNVAKVEFHSLAGQYAIDVSADDGRILAFEQTSEETEFLEWEQEVEIDDYITVEQVQDIIDGTLSEEGTIIEAQLEESDGVFYYRVQVDVAGGTGTFEIEARTGEILLYSVEENRRLEPISEQEAIDIALAEHEGVIDDIDLEEKDGRLVFEIEVENDETGIDVDLIIDAYTGEVLSVEYDN